MAYLPLPHPRENPRKKNTLGKEQPPSIIEVIRNLATSIEMISISKVRSPEIITRSIVKEKIQHKKLSIRSITNVISVARKVILGLSVNPKVKL